MGEPLPQIPGLEVLCLISSGGMGDVLLAKRTGAHGFEKLVAVKTIRPELAKRPEVRTMFLDEARLVARLEHPTITHVHDFGEEGDLLYLSMEYVPGVSFGQIREKAAGPVEPLMAAQLIAEALRGLHAAHDLVDLNGRQMEVVHRDVSPDNLILTFDGKVKILDFGIALVRDRETPHTELGSLKGKPAYMAPERLRGDPVDRRSDIFSSGVVLYELLTGEKLFSKGSVIATALAVESESVPPPSVKVGRLPEGLDEIVMRAIARQPEERFDNARDMAIALTDLARAHGALPLEAFMDMTFGEEREQHRRWLQAALEGEPIEVERKPLSLPPGPAEAVAHPLVDSTTLIPPSASEAMPRVQRSWLRPALVALMIVALPMAATFWLLSKPDSSIDVDPLPSAQATGANTVELAPSGAIPTVQIPDDSDEIDSEDESEPAPSKKRRSVRSRKKKKKVRAPGPAEPETFGFLTIGADPYARVRIDGEELGVTPIMNKKLPTGKHVVELLRPDTGELRTKRTIRIVEDKHRRLTIED